MKYKQIPEEMFKEFKPLDDVCEWEEFFKKYANGKTLGNGIISRYLGFANDVTIFWMEDEKYPFAYVFPRGLYEINGELKSGFRFFLREKL